MYREDIIDHLQQYVCTLQEESQIDYSIYDDLYHIRLYHLEKQVLHLFGLPDKPKEHTYLYRQAWLSLFHKSGIEKLYKKLSTKAMEYLSRDHSPEREMLSLAIDNREDPLNILPEIKVPVNVYSLYLYNEILLNSKKNLDAVLQEFNILKKEDNITSHIYILCLDKNYKVNILFHQLLHSGSKYLPVFLEWYHIGSKYLHI